MKYTSNCNVCHWKDENGIFQFIFRCFPPLDPRCLLTRCSYSNIKANIVPLHIPLTPGVGSKGFFSESAHVDIKLNGIKHTTTCKQRFCPYTLTQMGWGQKIKTFFFLQRWKCCISIMGRRHRTKQKQKIDLTQTLNSGVGFKGQISHLRVF